jgi:hypothetical protein
MTTGVGDQTPVSRGALRYPKFGPPSEDGIDRLLGQEERPPNRAPLGCQQRQFRTGYMEGGVSRSDQHFIPAQRERHASLLWWLSVWRKIMKERCAAPYTPVPFSAPGIAFASGLGLACSRSLGQKQHSGKGLMEFKCRQAGQEARTPPRLITSRQHCRVRIEAP